MLGATLKHHLENVPLHLQGTAEKLRESFYEDNCVTSVDSSEELSKLVQEASDPMSSGPFELREWTSNYSDDSCTFKKFSIKSEVSLLGLLWNREKDELFCNIKPISIPSKKITKRTLLSGDCFIKVLVI